MEVPRAAFEDTPIPTHMAGTYHPVYGPCVNTTDSLGNEVVPPPAGSLTIWSPAIADNVQGSLVTGDGFFLPVTILLPDIRYPLWRLPLRVTFVFSGTIEGYWRSNRGTVYGSWPQTLIVEKFRLVAGRPFADPNDRDYKFAVPLHAGGDWAWTIRDEYEIPLAEPRAALEGDRAIGGCESGFPARPVGGSAPFVQAADGLGIANSYIDLSATAKTFYAYKNDNSYWVLFPDGVNVQNRMSYPTTSEGVNIYILNTGIRTMHDAFLDHDTGLSRARNIKNLKDSDNFISLKVMSEGGSSHGLQKAINDVIEEHTQNRASNVPGFEGSVINMSLGLGDSPSMNYGYLVTTFAPG
ncbi:hypothetical protein B0T26DRAFT_750877 [Lasiosphaeria miniovina]|uniref:Uncharacterized protein n=1 Tax=Lasiosphaeria miniovina TaxID=1954250 RepID=A0AA40AX73_9PEZI|nr:uncharacterized protein B0T26DRAFT_750877 [Lasiosphaeria miniovina]KAK0723615.1 hypothetical protein B0T26DRAFT_750877 [Lasiosphaeria miniovina]